jgi:hypothetical protein
MQQEQQQQMDGAWARERAIAIKAHTEKTKEKIIELQKEIEEEQKNG